MMRKGLISLGLIFIAVWGLAAADGLTLVRDGIAQAEIVLGAKPTKSAQMAALELQDQIRSMTGAELPIIAAPSGKRQTRIFLGAGAAESTEKLSGEASLIRFQDQDVFIYGNDTPDYGKVDFKNPKTFPPVEYHYKGTLFAAYDFLEYYCGIRFYQPGPSGTFRPDTKTLTVPKKNRKFTSPMDAFRTASLKRTVSPRELALWRLRWRLNVSFGLTNHNAYGIYYRYWGIPKWGENRPEIRQLFQGKREEYFGSGFKGRNASRDHIMKASYGNDPDFPSIVCFTHPDVPPYFAGEAAAYARGGNAIGGWKNLRGQHPVNKTLIPKMDGLPFFYPIEPGDNNAFCSCRNCLEKFAGKVPPEEVFSNLKFYWIAQIAKELKKISPDAGVSTLAYIKTLFFPSQVDLPDNVAIQMCLPVYNWWHPEARKVQEAAYRKWMDFAGGKRPMFVWLYIFGPHWDMKVHFREKYFFPASYVNHLGEIMKQLGKDGIRGWFGEMESQYQPLEAMLSARMAYDPSIDPVQFMDEYYRNYYGKAAPEMKEFFTELEKIYWNPANYPSGWFGKDKVYGPLGAKHPMWTTGMHSPEVNWNLGSVANVKKLDALIRTALKKADTPETRARIQEYVDSVWAQALEGRRNYRPILNYVASKRTLRKFVFLPENGTALLKNWKALGGKGGDSSELAVSRKNGNLCFRYSGPAAGKTDSVSFYFAESPMGALIHLQCFPDGRLKGEKTAVSNDVRRTEPFDAKASLRPVSNEGQWLFELTVPEKSLPDLNASEQMSGVVNFARRSGKDVTVWSPMIVHGDDPAEGQKYFGKLCFSDSILIPAENFSLASSRGSDFRNGILETDGNQSWVVRWQYPDLPEGVYNIEVRLRTDAPAEKGLKVAFGFYETVRKKNRPWSFPVSKVSGKAFRTVQIRNAPMMPGGYFHLQKFNRKQPEGKEKIYLESIRLSQGGDSK